MLRTVRKDAAAEADGRAIRRHRVPDLTGMTIGTWRILHEEKENGTPYCLCQCILCGVRKIIPTAKFLKGYALRCPECRIRRDLAAAGTDLPGETEGQGL